MVRPAPWSGVRDGMARRGVPDEWEGASPAPIFSGYRHRVTEADRAAWQAWADGRAQEAFRRGDEASRAGRFDEAVQWLDRAARMARDNPHVLLALALAQLGAGHWGDVLDTARRISKRWSSREAFGLEALACSRMGDLDGALRAVAPLLARFAPSAEMFPLAGDLAEAAGFPGWCGANNRGELLGAASGPVRLRLSGPPGGVREVEALPAALPDGWKVARALDVTCAGRPLLGSPLDLAALRRSEGCVTPVAGGWEGWLWHPADPDFTPLLRIAGESGEEREIALSELAAGTSVDAPLARPRRFFLPSDALPPGPVAVTDRYGVPLPGSPLIPALGRLFDGAPSRSLPPGFRPVRVGTRLGTPEIGGRTTGWLVVIPAYRDLASLKPCLKRVLADRRDGVEVLVVDDATPEPALARFLDGLAAQGAITLVRHAVNRGFPAAANAGLRRAAGRDVVLLNSDTLVPPGWLERLGAVLDRAPEIGTATPFSNDASILSYPSATSVNPVPDTVTARETDRLCAALADAALVDLPTANGFCMAIRGDCLAQTGLLREDLFGRGYGEENEFCLRAAALGWRHVAAPTLFVTHRGSASFGDQRKALMQRNMGVLNALHPGYDGLIRRFHRRDPLAGLRRRLDMARMKLRRGRRPVLAMILHDGGGGVARVVRERGAAFARQGWFVVTIRPDVEGCRVAAEEGDFPNLLFRLPAERDDLVAFLAGIGTQAVEWHHLVGHAPEIRRLHEWLGVPCDIFVHDYAAFCQRIALSGAEGRFCGEPDVAGCIACVRERGSYLGETIGVKALLRRSAREFAAARRVMAPSGDAVRRLQRHFPALSVETVPLEDDAARRVTRRAPGPGRRIGIVGGIGVEKGFDVVLDLARDARARDLPVEFVLIGHTPDDEALMATGRVWVTGEYRSDEIGRLIAGAELDLGLIPSICPETWCFALGDLWHAGVPAVVFDLGAQAERVRRTGLGWVVPPSLPAAMFNNLLLSL
ncbi:glycosyltransferase [Acidomonas methanolica]|uniref:glycosyltransferase n=1 Tax=Acidomonas methanolica TaxID=437 RepID=UPI00211A21EE|nr:glycosyltransferase [Acidomonas methanolica]